MYHWLKRPISLAIPLVILALLFTVSCGTAEQSDTSGSSPVMPAAQEPVKAADMAPPTAIPHSMSVPQQAKGQLDRVTIAVAPLGWDTNYSYKVTTSGLLDKRPVLEWLVDIDRDTGEYIPNLATSWEMAPNGKDWTFMLQKGVQFQAGPGNPAGWGEFTAKDVKHSLWLLVHPDSAASGLGNWRKMTGVVKGDDYPAVTAKIDEMVEIVDEYTVVIKNKTVQPEYLFFIGTRRNMPIESKARWDAVGHEGYGKAILGTGPLKFIERIEGVHVTYEALPEHWRKVADYKNLEFRWVGESATRLATLLTGEVHLSDIERSARAEAANRGMKTIQSSFPATQVRWYLGGQYYTEPEQMQAGEPFHNKKVRQAMNKAINRQAIVDSFLPGSDVLLPYFHPFHPVLDEAVWPGITNAQWLEQYDEMYGYDPVRARALLVEAGYPEGFEFTHYLFTLPGLPEMVEIGQAMALDWEAIGLKPKMENLEFSAVRKKYRSYNMHDAMWGIRSATTAHYAMIGFNTTSTTTHYYQVPELDAKMAELDRTIQNEERARLLREMGDILYFDFAMIQMFSLSSEIMVDPTAVAGYKFPGLMSGFYTHLEYIETVPQ